MELQGHPRADGRVGFRNRVLVLPLTGCQMSMADRIARACEDTTCFAHPNGCDLQGPDAELLGAILAHTATHPNVGGVVFLAMGCAATLGLGLPKLVRESGRLATVLPSHQGTTATIEAGVAAVREMQAELAKTERVPVDFAGLTVGTKCGASDDLSFSHCHPVVGRACDMLVERGATVVLSEDCELVASAHLLAERAATPEIAAKLRAMPDEVNAGWSARFGYSLEERVLEAVSAEAWTAKSLQHAEKAGSGPINGFFDVAETVHGPGLVVLNGPNTDLECVTALAAAGCNVTLFTTGRGTPVGSPTSITLKITATAATAERMAENIDVSVADYVAGEETLDEAAGRVAQAVVDAANGGLAAAERLGHWEVAVPIRGVTY